MGIETLVGRFINLPGHKKNFKCPFCKEYTEHISVSYVKYNNFKNPLLKVASRLNDINPVANLAVGNPYVCSQSVKT